MTAIPIVPGSCPGTQLSFAGTVDRGLIHRRHASEAFLTDAVRTGPDSFSAAALLPASHPHYRGHTGPSRDWDSLLLLECARQAETYVAHAMFDVAPDAHFVLRSWSAEFATDLLPAAGPTELLMTGQTANPRLVRDQLRGLDYRLELWAAGSWLGRVSMQVSYLSGAAHAVIRARKHHGSPPSSDRLAPSAGCPIEPSRVGRLRAADAVLLDVRAVAGQVRAVLRVPTDNPSLFDHVQDHVPAMVLVEAGRQLAGLASQQWGGAGPDRTRLAAMSSSFSAYAELAEPIELTGRPATDGSVEVGFRQDGSDIAQARIGMAIPAGRVLTGSAPERGTTCPGLR